MPHTPGPWTLVTDTAGFIDIRKDEMFMTICSIKADADPDSQDAKDAIADARLIAAAPDLLATCEGAKKDLTHLVDHWDEYSPSHIRHALSDLVSELIAPSIANAKGES